MDYFTLFNLPKKFNVDQSLLSENFYKLQLQFHPDLFINDSKLKKKTVLEKTIQINKGYKILKNFLSRAIYLLSLNGFKIKEETISLKNKDFLIKYFSLYEELDNLKKNSFNEKKTNIFLTKIDKKISSYQTIIEIKFESECYEKIIEVIAKILFFKKIKIHLKKEQDVFLKQIK